MSKTLARSAASLSLRRSKSRVPSPRSRSDAATRAFRGLRRLLPLPWANTTTASAPSGSASVPSSPRGGTQTSDSSVASSLARGAIACFPLHVACRYRGQGTPRPGRWWVSDEPVWGQAPRSQQ